MAYELWKSPTQEAHVIVTIVFTPLGILVFALRIYATKRAGRKPGFEDWSK